ncbi:MAG TPA: ABC transporter permease, partial [Bacteroides coprosuis]|nr:ABC transporter permease [Bacteroides coprosuis]
MNNRLKYIFRSILNNGKSSFFKLITLSIGIAIALVLLTKVFYVRSYDSFYPNKERIYRVEPIYTLLRQDDTEKKHYEKISGGVVVGMANEISGVEAGTRFMHLTVDGFLKTEKDKELKATALLGDENFFDVLYRPIIQGD